LNYRSRHEHPVTDAAAGGWFWLETAYRVRERHVRIATDAPYFTGTAEIRNDGDLSTRPVTAFTLII